MLCDSVSIFTIISIDSLMLSDPISSLFLQASREASGQVGKYLHKYI